ncbi:hypothetical protein [Clostridium pasteurianum]|nr:hypothetical protein [Clostridium pasteurianum]
MKQEATIEFVHGCGKRRTPIQRSIEKLEEYLNPAEGMHMEFPYLR